MENEIKITKPESYIVSLLGKIPILSYYSHSRGWSFLISWGHRLSGLTLVFYMFAHLYTLSLLFKPEQFDADMQFLNNFLFTFLEWSVAIPVIFHALNGGRLILYEMFHVRAEEMIIRLMVIIGIIYIAIVGFFFIEEGRQISAIVFWSITSIISLVAFFIVLFKLWSTGNSLMWKLQRITGGFMFLVLIGHMLFMHMNYLTGHDSKTILLRMQSPFIKGVDFIFILFLLFHAGYGMFSIATDYLRPGPVLKSLTFLIIVVMLVSAFFGIRLLAAL
jgi:succinate dehydrogenase cytochrome b556 subunit/succinate dehydrogenase hydrophobic membrane anchor protein